MITFLLIIVAVVLFGVGYTLLKKQEFFFALIQKNEANQSLLKTYGGIYIFLGIVALFIAFLDHKTIAMLYLAVMLLVSASFSLIVAKNAQF